MGTTFLKRQKEMKRLEKQREKAERRAQKKAQVGQPQDENATDDIGYADPFPEQDQLSTINTGSGDTFEINPGRPKL